MNHELEYDTNTLFVADIDEVDESFDHAHGRERKTGYEITDFAVIVYINDIDYDVTGSIPEPTIEQWKEKTLEDYIDKVNR